MQHRFVILTLTLLLLLQASSYPKTANAASAVWKSWSSRKIRSNEDTSASSSSSSSSSESDSSEAAAAVLALNIVSDCQDIPKDFRLIIKRYFHIDKNIDDDYSIYRYRAKLIKDSIADLYEKIENLSFNLSRYLSKTYDSGSHEQRQPDDFVNTTLVDGSLILGTMYDVGLQLIEALQQLHDRLVVVDRRKMFLANNAMMTSTSTTAIVETKLLLLPVSSEFKVSFVKERLMPSVNRLKSTCEFLIRNLLPPPPPLQNNSAEN